MTAREAISHITNHDTDPALRSVESSLHLLEVLPLLLDAPSRMLAVRDGEETVGYIDQSSMLEALGRLIAARFDCSVIELECPVVDYSASHIARAVEDSDVHLVDLLTTPGSEGRLHVTLRVRCEDPTSTVHCLERYGYEITSVHGRHDIERTAAMERLLALQALLSV